MLLDRSTRRAVEKQVEMVYHRVLRKDENEWVKRFMDYEVKDVEPGDRSNISRWDVLQ